jgi:diguanylate cyclase (GGDEF)-like protein
MSNFDKYQRTAENLKDSILEENRMLTRKLAESQQSFELLKFVHYDKSISFDNLNDIIVGCTGCLYSFMFFSDRIISNLNEDHVLYKNIISNKDIFVSKKELYISKYILRDHRVVVYPILPSQMLSDYISIDCVVLIYPNKFFTEETLDFIKSFLIVNDVMINIVMMKEKMNGLIEKDPLTHLLNRSSWDMTLKTLIRNKQAFFILFLDIDHFKDINDRFGHQIGDEVLKFTSKWLSSHFRTTDKVYRLGGDEFAVIGAIDSDHIQNLEEKFQALNLSFNQELIKSFDINFTISLGVFITDQTSELETIYKKVDDLLYKSKEKGRNQMTLSYDLKSKSIDLQ